MKLKELVESSFSIYDEKIQPLLVEGDRRGFYVALFELNKLVEGFKTKMRRNPEEFFENRRAIPYVGFLLELNGALSKILYGSSSAGGIPDRLLLQIQAFGAQTRLPYND